MMPQTRYTSIVVRHDLEAVNVLIDDAPDPRWTLHYFHDVGTSMYLRSVEQLVQYVTADGGTCVRFRSPPGSVVFSKARRIDVTATLLASAFASNRSTVTPRPRVLAGHRSAIPWMVNALPFVDASLYDGVVLLGSRQQLHSVDLMGTVNHTKPVLPIALETIEPDELRDIEVPVVCASNPSEVAHVLGTWIDKDLGGLSQDMPPVTRT